MDMLSFAAGLAIGKKKYGGKYDPVYHDILQNHVPIYTYNFGNHFKWVLGAWIAREERFEVRDNGLDSIYAAIDGETHSAAALERHRQTLYTIGIVYKDDLPKYATTINWVSNPSESWAHYWIESTKTALFYKSIADYQLGTVVGFECKQFEPEFRSGYYNGYFESDITCVISCSYQTYTYNDISGRVEKNGGRTQSAVQLSYALSNYMHPYPRLNGGYSDLGVTEWKELLHELTEEIYMNAGYSILNYRILPTPV